MNFKRVANRSKYGNSKVEYQGIKFDSKREMQRYIILKDAENKGVISDLRMQVKFELIPAVKETYIQHLKTKDKECTRTLQLPITYTCDFAYIKDNELVIEDVKISKSMLPKEYVLKKKMMFALKGIKIREIYKVNEPI
jgi:hypothetical protein